MPKAKTEKNTETRTVDNDPWFSDPEETSGAKGSPKDGRLLYLKYGESLNIIPLDKDPPEGSEKLTAPVLLLSEVWGFEDDEHKYPTYVACPSVKGTSSILGDYAEKYLDESSLQEGQLRKKLIPAQYYITTVLVTSKEETYKAIRLVPVKMAYHVIKKIQEFSSIDEGPLADFNGLENTKVVLARATEKENKMAAKVGEIGSPIKIFSQEELEEIHPSPVPFTREELKNMFVYSDEQIQDYVDRRLDKSRRSSEPVIND